MFETVVATVGGAAVEPCPAGKASAGVVDDHDTDPSQVSGTFPGCGSTCLAVPDLEAVPDPEAGTTVAGVDPDPAGSLGVAAGNDSGASTCVSTCWLLAMTLGRTR